MLKNPSRLDSNHPFEFRVPLEESFGRGDPAAPQQAHQLKGVGDRFSPEMIIGDDISNLGLVRNMANFLLPGVKLGEGVEVVIALLGKFAGFDPFFVVASVEAHISERGGIPLGGGKRGADLRLVDIAESTSRFSSIR